MPGNATAMQEVQWAWDSGAERSSCSLQGIEASVRISSAAEAESDVVIAGKSNKARTAKKRPNRDIAAPRFAPSSRAIWIALYLFGLLTTSNHLRSRSRCGKANQVDRVRNWDAATLRDFRFLTGCAWKAPILVRPLNRSEHDNPLPLAQFASESIASINPSMEPRTMAFPPVGHPGLPSSVQPRKSR